jgi:hypothetical protein
MWTWTWTWTWMWMWMWMSRCVPREVGNGTSTRFICGLALTAGPASAATTLLTNPGFETGTLSGWVAAEAEAGRRPRRRPG